MLTNLITQKYNDGDTLVERKSKESWWLV